MRQTAGLFMMMFGVLALSPLWIEISKQNPSELLVGGTKSVDSSSLVLTIGTGEVLEVLIAILLFTIGVILMVDEVKGKEVRNGSVETS